MTGDKNVKKKKHDLEKTATPREAKRPDWSLGLRQLYNSVVEEPLPDSFNELLSKFDSDD